MKLRRAAQAAALLTVTGAMALGPALAASAQPAAAPQPTPPAQSKTVHGPLMFYNVPTTEAINGKQGNAVKPAITPPPVLACLPVTPPSPVPGCVPPPPPAGEPWPVNMAYFGGPVQTSPQIYLVYWGWDTPGAFTSCANSAATTGNWPACDPDGAGQRMYNFVDQLGGSSFAATSTQYYQTNPDGTNSYVTNPTKQLYGVWVDDSSHLNLPSTASVGDVQTQLGAEATKAVAHFGIKDADLNNVDIVIAQPAQYSDPAAQSAGYCAWHDYTQPNLEGGVYNADKAGIPFTNMPYVLNQGTSCGQNVEGGNLDGFSIVLGHEIEETVTDPGAEDVVNGTNLGGWYDNEAYEIGDKCAWVGANETGVGPTILPIPGAVGTTTGNKGTVFPVQSLWSNEAAGGVGYCAGAGTDLPAGPAASVPEVPLALLIPIAGLVTAFGAVALRRRRKAAVTA